MQQTLVDIFKEIGDFSGTDGGHNDKGGLHSYLEVYDKLFAPFQSGCNFLEIGLAMGKSIELFDRYFDNSRIMGCDISLVFPYGDYKNEVSLFKVDATKPELLNIFCCGIELDLCIDDGSHVTQDQITTFNLLKPKMKPGSIYIIEDLLALDIERDRYLALHENVEIIDMRHINGRFDNCLCIIRF